MGLGAIHVDVVVAGLPNIVEREFLLDGLAVEPNLDRELSQIVVVVLEHGHDAQLSVRFEQAIVPALIRVDLGDSGKVGHLVAGRVVVRRRGRLSHGHCLSQDQRDQAKRNERADAPSNIRGPADPLLTQSTVVSRWIGGLLELGAVGRRPTVW